MHFLSGRRTKLCSMPRVAVGGVVPACAAPMESRVLALARALFRASHARKLAPTLYAETDHEAAGSAGVSVVVEAEGSPQRRNRRGLFSLFEAIAESVSRKSDRQCRLARGAYAGRCGRVWRCGRRGAFHRPCCAVLAGARSGGDGKTLILRRLARRVRLFPAPW